MKISRTATKTEVIICFLTFWKKPTEVEGVTQTRMISSCHLWRKGKENAPSQPAAAAIWAPGRQRAASHVQGGVPPRTSPSVAPRKAQQPRHLLEDTLLGWPVSHRCSHPPGGRGRCSLGSWLGQPALRSVQLWWELGTGALGSLLAPRALRAPTIRQVQS